MNTITKLALVALVAAPLVASAEEAKGPTVSFSGMVDSYYTANLTHGQEFVSPTGGYTAEPGFNLNFAKITAVAEADQASFRLDVGLAKEGALIGSQHPVDVEDPAAGTFPTFVQQAYASYDFGAFTLEAGRFVTPAGFEVFESKDNWTFSKGLLFNYAVPTAHEGVRLSVDLFEGLTATAYVANGSDLWSNDFGFSRSPYKTGILNLFYSKDETSASVTGFYGYIPGTDAAAAYQVDVVLTQGFGPLAVNVSGDYVDVDGSKILAGAANVKFDLMSNLALVARAEYLDDEDGIRTGFLDADGEGATLMSFTGGLNLAVGTNAALKGEVRMDRASEDIYGLDDPKDNVVTVTVGAIAWF